MISTLDELRIPIVKGQDNLDAVLMQQLLGSFDALLTMDENGFTDIDTINLPNINYSDELRVLNVKKIRKMLTEVASRTYNDFEWAYEYRHKKFIPFDEFDDLQFDLELIISAIVLAYNELLDNPVIKMNVSRTAKVMSTITPNDALRVLVNDAKQSFTLHSKDVYSDLRASVRSLINSSVRYNVSTAEKRYAMRMTSVVDNLMLDAISRVRSNVFTNVDSDIQFDGIELSAHTDSAIDHAPIQGHQFSTIEFNKLQSAQSFVDYQGRTYAPIERAIGEWNCRHVASPIILGVTKQTFSQDELDAINNEASKRVVVLGKELSKRDALALLDKYTKQASRNKEASIEAGVYGDTVLSQSYLKNYVKYKQLCESINKSLRAM